MSTPGAMPTVIILRAVKRTLLAFDWIAAGLAARPRIRHARRRYSTPDEYPCITIRWEKDEPRESSQDSTYLTADEMYVDMLITIEVETDPSDSLPVDEPGEAEDDDDEITGLEESTQLAGLAMRALKDPEGELCRLWANGVSDRGRGEDPDSTPDEARFDQSAYVLYRVLTADPSVLLAEGMNA